MQANMKLYQKKRNWNKNEQTSNETFPLDWLCSVNEFNEQFNLQQFAWWPSLVFHSDRNVYVCVRLFLWMKRKIEELSQSV